MVARVSLRAARRSCFPLGDGRQRITESIVVRCSVNEAQEGEKARALKQSRRRINSPAALL